MDSVHKQEYRIRDLPTRSVTLFPTRAQVLRDIKDVPLKPGTNEITILGLSPSVDEDSIKVEGTGSATISDIAVTLLPNSEIFQEVYPDEEDEDAETGSEGEEEDIPPEDSDELKSVRRDLMALRDKVKHAAELSANAESRLKILDAYGTTLGATKGVDIENGIDVYRRSREAVFEDHENARVKQRSLSTEIAELAEKEARLIEIQQKEIKKAAKAKAKIKKNKDKAREKEQLRQAEKEKEKTRIRQERQRFWPRYCWSVRIILDVVAFTPSSSRRSSIASASEIVKAMPDKEPTAAADPEAATSCDLSLSYVTSSAWWAPRYDLALTTTSNTGRLYFDAQLTNKTSENWANCKIVLSTSQTTFSGIQDAIPTLVPWRVRLGAKGTMGGMGAMGVKPSGVLDSREERAQKGGWLAQQNAWGAQKGRNYLYGHPNHAANVFGASNLAQQAPPDLFGSAPQQQQQQQQQQQPYAPASTHNVPPAPVASTGDVFGRSMLMMNAQGLGASNTAPQGFGASNTASQDEEILGPSALGQQRKRSYKPLGVEIPADVTIAYDGLDANDVVAQEGNDDDTMLNLDPDLTFQESAFEETGMTTTYDLPGLKTLNTSATASKQRVARVTFSNVVFSHTIIAKYRPVAYLKAKLRNASKFTLLKGPVGLSLDGSFIGRSTLARCSAGDSMSVSLGIDPSIRVTYPKPEVKRSRSGLFTKEDSHVYTRTVNIYNTRLSAGSKPVSLVVLDQVPVSEDDKLRIEIANPKGMSVGGGGVRTGVAAKDGGDDKGWGMATATLKKAGEVCWDVVLNPGRGVRLALEYEVALPAGDTVDQC